MSESSDKYFYDRVGVYLGYVDDSKGLILKGNKFTLVSVGKNLGTAFEYACRIKDSTLVDIVNERIIEKKNLVDHWIREHWPVEPPCNTCLDRESQEDV